MTKPHVSDWDREYFRRIGEWKAERHREALEHASRMTARERIEMSLRRTRLLGRPRNDERNALDLDAFYERARSRGLYRP